MGTLSFYAGWALAAAAMCGGVYAVLAAVLAGRFMRPRVPDPALAEAPGVTILKPLHGDEPGLLRNLETVLRQDYPGAVQVVFGVQDEADPALAAVRALRVRHPQADIAVAADPARAGANAKISNVINMMPHARHDLLVLADSDIAAPPCWLSRVVEALSRPGIGIVTCLYTGEPDTGAAGSGRRLWPVLAAMGTSYGFLPNALLGFHLGLAKPCFGSTIALRRATLERIGGFAAFADRLADDYEIGRAVRDTGLDLAIPALAVGHAATEASAAALWRHELRWSRTIRIVNPGGHLGSFVTHGFPLALAAAVLLGFGPISLGIVAFALAARLFLKYRIDGIFGTRAGPGWLVPIRDVLSFAVFVASLFGGTVHWRGDRFAVGPAGALSRS
ncbi:MAG: hypothetical protein BGN82_05310 [Alphaproteobacteria bacterium 65-7]|nr:MAG: hypothetical protein BGN82_05310 [Alphaproteobacteria bacterium 65-7]